MLDEKYAFHILFLFPTITYNNICEAIQLRKNLKIDIIVVGSILPEDNISFLIGSGISGFVSLMDMECDQINNVIRDIHKQGYVVNKHISQQWWNTKKKLYHHFPKNRPPAGSQMRNKE